MIVRRKRRSAEIATVVNDDIDYLLIAGIRTGVKGQPSQALVHMHINVD